MEACIIVAAVSRLLLFLLAYFDCEFLCCHLLCFRIGLQACDVFRACGWASGRALEHVILMPCLAHHECRIPAHAHACPIPRLISTSSRHPQTDWRCRPSDPLLQHMFGQCNWGAGGDAVTAIHVDRFGRI